MSILLFFLLVAFFGSARSAIWWLCLFMLLFMHAPAGLWVLFILFTLW